MSPAARDRHSQWRDQRPRLDDRGDTLVEVLLAIVVIALAATAILGAFTTAITASAVHRNGASLTTIMKSYVEDAIFEIQLQPSPLFSSCATSYTLSSAPTPPTGYTVSITSIQYWNGSDFGSTCTAGSLAPQLVTITGNGPNITSTLSFVVSSTSYSEVLASPTFTSASSASYTQGTAFSFTVTTTGSPPPALSATGLPTGVTFTDNGNGTGTLAGTTSVAAGQSTITFTANNSVPTTPPTQTFTLNIGSPVVFTNTSVATPLTYSIAHNGTMTSSNLPVTASGTTPITYSYTVSGKLTSGSTVTTLPGSVTFTKTTNGTGNYFSGAVGATTGTWTITVTGSNLMGSATGTYIIKVT